MGVCAPVCVSSLSNQRWTSERACNRDNNTGEERTEREQRQGEEAGWVQSMAFSTQLDGWVMQASRTLSLSPYICTCMCVAGECIQDNTWKPHSHTQPVLLIIVIIVLLNKSTRTKVACRHCVCVMIGVQLETFKYFRHFSAVLSHTLSLSISRFVCGDEHSGSPATLDLYFFRFRADRTVKHPWHFCTNYRHAKQTHNSSQICS